LPPSRWVAVSLAGALKLGAGADSALYEPLWSGHVVGSCPFILCVPVTRLIHDCAAPTGRPVNSRKGLLEAKRRASISGMLQNRSEAPKAR
jgi:hypothetical protein